MRSGLKALTAVAVCASVLVGGVAVAHGLEKPTARVATASFLSPQAPPPVFTRPLPKPAPAAAPVRVAPKLPAVNCSKRGVKCVALTFDDGPGPYTDKLLRILRASHVKATFFMIGRSVTQRPKTAAHVAAAGMEVCGHSWKHDDLTTLTPAQLRRDFARVRGAIRKATGVNINCERPPYGSFNKKVLANTDAALISWTVDTLDWKYRNVRWITNAAVKVRPRGVIIMHDIHPKSVDSVPGIIKALRANGFTFVTVGQMVGGASHLRHHVDYF